MDIDQILEIAGTIIGLFYLYYEYKASMLVWIAGIIMPAISLFVYYRHGLYADFGINIYYLLAAIYGWIVWKYGKKKNENPVLVLVFVLSFLGIGYVLINHTDSNVPWWDSFTTALSIVGMWMLARKWLEQWIAWILVDAVSCGLYIYKGVYFYSGLYGIYTIIAIFGYLEWKRKMKETL